MTSPLGPQIERLNSSDRVTFAAFASVVGCLLADGLVFPYPFDVATSAILADNATDGNQAIDLFRHLCRRTSSAFHVRLVEVAETTDGVVEREVLDTRLPRTVMAELLMDIAGQLWNEGDGDGQTDDIRPD